MIEVKHLSKSYGLWNMKQQVLEDLSFTIHAGEFVGVMGPSGAGKSTLLKIIASLLLPTTGSIRLAGQDLTQLSEDQVALFRRDHLGFIFQEFHLVDTLTVKDNILLPLLLKKVNKKESLARLLPIVKALGLETVLERYPEELSVGQRQKIASARAFITKPELILADEPTGALDSKSAADFLYYLEQMGNEKETTILMVTHDAFTASFCHRVLFIKDGAFFAEIVRGEKSRREFFDQVIDMQATIGGGGAANAN